MTCALSGYGSGTSFRDAWTLILEDERLCECGRYEQPDPDRVEHDDRCPARGFLEVCLS